MKHMISMMHSAVALCKSSVRAGCHLLMRHQAHALLLCRFVGYAGLLALHTSPQERACYALILAADLALHWFPPGGGR